MMTSGDRPRRRPQKRVRYRAHARELREIATAQFGLPDAVAQELVHDILLSSLLRIGSSDLRSWLRGAMVCAARRFKEGS
jgi:hypothetical protein